MKKTIYILFAVFSLLSCSKPNYCECREISRDAISRVDVDLDGWEDCAEKVKEDLNFSIQADEIGINFIYQVSYEMCEYGYYEGKHSNDRGKKYYPSSK